jgi:hypothetical protein
LALSGLLFDCLTREDYRVLPATFDSISSVTDFGASW